MKAEMETLPSGSEGGIIVISETPEQKERLLDCWNGHASVVCLTTLDDGNIELIIAPKQEKEMPTCQK